MPDSNTLHPISDLKREAPSQQEGSDSCCVRDRAANSELPDPADRPAADVVIYDGECNFCISQVRKLRAFDCCGGRLSFLSLHDSRVKELYPDLTYEQLMEQMYVVDDSGRRHGGADAVRYLTRRLPLLWGVMPLLHIPGTARLWRWLYKQVAKRRYKLAGKRSENAVCEGDACSVHFD